MIRMVSVRTAVSMLVLNTNTVSLPTIDFVLHNFDSVHE
jgi:hypothetical protein